MFASVGQYLFFSSSIFAHGLSPNLAARSWRAGGARRPSIGQNEMSYDLVLIVHNVLGHKHECRDLNVSVR